MNNRVHLVNFNLRLAEKYPFDSKPYLYADYFELVALFNHDKIGVGEMLDRLKDEGILRTDDDGSMRDIADIKDEEEANVRRVFALIQQRSCVFGELYPFQYHNGFLEVHSSLTNPQKLYIFLLLASNLNLFSSYLQDITSEFEFVSKKALTNYLPKFAVIKGFGKRSDFSGYAIDKVRQLAKLMNVETDETFLSTVPKNSTQDLGLDIVGWMPLDDGIGNYISVFCQCACGKDWSRKIAETRRYDNFLKVYLSKINHAIFIPYSLANYEKSIFYEHHIFGPSILVFERYRILSLIKEDTTLFNMLQSKAFVDYCIDYHEDVV